MTNQQRQTKTFLSNNQKQKMKKEKKHLDHHQHDDLVKLDRTKLPKMTQQQPQKPISEPMICNSIERKMIVGPLQEPKKGNVKGGVGWMVEDEWRV